ncbi:MAG: hypothetical protein NT007_00220 [Candidatus Kapabacteria bacterium]|nr:hypothetical protein [Candidatus Kapabacteria bacterium]
MSNKMTIKDLLLYSPYDNNRRSMSFKDISFNSIRITPDIYNDESKNLSQALDTDSNFEKQFLIISGYSGNGKTTFIYWFKERYCNNTQNDNKELWMDIINLIEEGHGIKNDFSLLQKAIIFKYRNKVVNIETLNFIKENQHVFIDYFVLGNFDKIINLSSDDNYHFRKSHDLLICLSFEELLILFLLDNILGFKNTKFSNIKSFTFCFDNLDELRFEYITPKMWSAILDISSKMTNIIQNTDLGFDYLKKIKFILIFREANIACGVAQLEDRLSPSTRDKRFIYTTEVKSIIRKRLDLITWPLDENDQLLKKFIEIIIDDKIFDDIILPLFNYDYRKVVEAILNFVQPEYIDSKEYRLFSISIEDYQKIPLKYKYLTRGIIINLFIRYFAIENYLSKLAPIREDLSLIQSHCNKTRLMLTVFSNLSFPQGFPINKKELAEIKPNPFSILQAFDNCKSFVDINEFISRLQALIDLDKSSWAHLITVYGKEPKRQANSYFFDFTEELELLKKYFENNMLNIDDSNHLNKITISLNASSYIYLRHILPHFEYISSYKTRYNGITWYSYKPLIQLTGITFETDDQNGPKIPFWEFEVKIKSVYEIVKAYKNHNNNYLESNYKELLPSSTIANYKQLYCESNFVFKGEYESVNSSTSSRHFSFYSTRIITTHIRYLDNFRHYITHEGYEIIEKKIKDMPELKRNLKINDKTSLNNFLLEYIDKYLKLLDLIKDPTILKVKLKLTESLQKVKTNFDLTVSVDEYDLINQS